MNKSTPIAQLPSNNMQPGNFINEQQRQYITQAQQAISNTHMPQNTQMSSDIANDDDIVVQDILNQINASSSAAEQNSTSNGEPPININSLNQQLLMQQMASQQNGPSQMHQMMSGQGMNGAYPPQALYQLAGGFNPQDVQQPQNQLVDYRSYLFQFTDDLKLASLVFFIVILVHFVPLDTMISKYFAIDRIPYHNILLRAMMAAILIIIIKKLAKI